MDFTNEEITEVFGLPPSMVADSPKFADVQRNYTHPLFHDILRSLLQTAANIHEEDGAIVGDVMNRELELSIFSGRQPVIMGEGTMPFVLARRPFSGVKEERGVFRVWLTDGKISKCVLDFTRAGVATRGENAGAAYTQQHVYTYDIMDIGTTEVDIGPDIRAVFNDVAIKR